MSDTTKAHSRRVLLLVTPQTYRAGPFIEAARRLGIDIVPALDLPPKLAEFWHEPLGVDFNDPAAATAAIVTFAADHPLDAIIAVDDSGSLLAARASAAL